MLAGPLNVLQATEQIRRETVSYLYCLTVNGKLLLHSNLALQGTDHAHIMVKSEISPINQNWNFEKKIS
jgi:hypothetical protein